MDDKPLTLAQVLWEERAALEGPESKIEGLGGKGFYDLSDADDLDAIYQQFNADNRWALCLSGGGIRSAAFALGIVQCLANCKAMPKPRSNNTKPTLGDPEPMLAQFDYLSTVSGGGYLGSWLSTWLF